MKNLILFIAISLVSLTSIKAQDNREMPPAKERAEMQTELIAEKLELTYDQKTKVYDINLSSALKMDKLKEIEDRTQKFKQFRTIQLEKDEQLKKVLTKEQFKKYKKFKAEIRKRIMEKRKEKKKNS
jgi:Spy/CpxP family protein refolding chaperone